MTGAGFVRGSLQSTMQRPPWETRPILRLARRTPTETSWMPGGIADPGEPCLACTRLSTLNRPDCRQSAERWRAPERRPDVGQRIERRPKTDLALPRLSGLSPIRWKVLRADAETTTFSAWPLVKLPPRRPKSLRPVRHRPGHGQTTSRAARERPSKWPDAANQHLPSRKDF